MNTLKEKQKIIMENGIKAMDGDIEHAWKKIHARKAGKSDQQEGCRRQVGKEGVPHRRRWGGGSRRRVLQRGGRKEEKNEEGEEWTQTKRSSEPKN